MFQINSQIALSEISSFPKLFLDYIHQNENLKDFYGNFPDLSGFKKQIDAKNKFDHRETLVETLKKHYARIENPPANIDLLLNDNTFTVCTGHQMNIFTGPLYVIYKIVSTINLAKKLKKAFPEFHFVPIYWMASEDHDFAEINHFNLFGKTHHWESTQKGAVGRMNPNELSSIINEVKENLEVFEKAYLNENTLSNAVRYYMHQYFGKEGLVCLDGDDKSLKTLFKPIIKADVLDFQTENSVYESSKKLEQLGYKTQIAARKVNFFYLENNLRERIDVENESYQINNSTLKFSKDEIADLIEAQPEKFSPNVVLRPLYQETILPNLAYLGGPAEVAYWLQLKEMFESYNIAFPIVMPRNFALIINQNLQKRLSKLGLTASELFKNENTLKREFVEKNSTHTLSFENEMQQIEHAFAEIAKKTAEIDASLVATVEGEKTKTQKAISSLESRIKKAEERKFEQAIDQILNLKEKLFPAGGLQERHDNFLNFQLNNPNFINQLLEVLDPLDLRFNILMD